MRQRRAVIITLLIRGGITDLDLINEQKNESKVSVWMTLCLEWLFIFGHCF